MILLAIAIDGTNGLPIWALFLSVLLTGGGGAALWNLISARMAHKAEREVTASTANLNDVAALNNALTGLAGENQRMAKRIGDLENQVDILTDEMSRRPTKQELRATVEAMQDYIDGLRAYIDVLRAQLLKAGIHPTAEIPPSIKREQAEPTVKDS